MTGTSKEYAVALFSLAKEEQHETEIYDGLLFVKEVFENTPELYAFMRSPGISKQVRLDTVRDAFCDVPEHVLSFLLLLCEHGDAELLPSCIEEFEKLYDRNMNICHALVTCAVELTDAEKDKLKSTLEAKTGKNLKLEYRTDPALMGGMTVEMDGIIIDGSLKHRLHTIKEVMDV